MTPLLTPVTGSGATPFAPTATPTQSATPTPTTNANAPNQVDFSYIARQYYKQDLYILEASSAGITILPLINRLKAYEMYKCCDYICVRRLKARRTLVPTTPVLTNRTALTNAVASAAANTSTISQKLQFSPAPHACSNSRSCGNGDGKTGHALDSDTDSCFPESFDPFTIYRLNSFLVTVQRAPYGFHLSSMLFAPKIKNSHADAKGSAESSSNTTKAKAKEKKEENGMLHALEPHFASPSPAAPAGLSARSGAIHSNTSTSTSTSTGIIKSSSGKSATKSAASIANINSKSNSYSCNEIVGSSVRDSLAANLRGSFRLTDGGWSTYGSDDEQDVRLSDSRVPLSSDAAKGDSSNGAGGTAAAATAPAGAPAENIQQPARHGLETHREGIYEDYSPHTSVDMGINVDVDEGFEGGKGMNLRAIDAIDGNMSDASIKIETLRSESVFKDVYTPPHLAPTAAVVATPAPAESIAHAEPEAEVQVQNRSFFCSALTAAALQVLHVLPASYNDNYFWPGSFATGGLVDNILRHNAQQIVHAVSHAGAGAGAGAGAAGAAFLAVVVAAERAAGARSSCAYKAAAAAAGPARPPAPRSARATAPPRFASPARAAWPAGPTRRRATRPGGSARRARPAAGGAWRRRPSPTGPRARRAHCNGRSGDPGA